MKAKKKLKILQEFQSNNNLTYAQKGVFAEVLMEQDSRYVPAHHIRGMSTTTSNVDEILAQLVKLNCLIEFHKNGEDESYYKVNDEYGF